MLSPKNVKRSVPDTPASQLERQIWHLAHLVNAATSELSACISYNSLLQQANGSHQYTSEIWHSSFSLSRKSLVNFVKLVYNRRHTMPMSIPQQSPGEPVGHTSQELLECEKKARAYIALVTAAHATQGILSLMTRLDVAESGASAGYRREFLGWVDGDDLIALKDIHTDLLRFRDRGIDDHNVGWKACWLAFTERAGVLV